MHRRDASPPPIEILITVVCGRRMLDRMATTIERPAIAGHVEVAGAQQRRLRPVMFWALIGAAFLSLLVYLWVDAAVSGDLHATTIGRDSASDWSKISVHGQEALLGAVAL